MGPSGQRLPDPRWQEAFSAQADVATRVSDWAVGDAVPAPVADVLRVARMLLIDSYYVYDDSLVAVTWALMAAEASLKRCMPFMAGGPDKRTFVTLVAEAAGQKRGLITKEEAAALRGAAELRNLIVHGHLQVKPASESYSPTNVMTMLEAIHAAISDIYARAACA